MELNRAICCRELRESDVVGSDGEKIGRIGDMTFTFDGELKLSQFILSGPVFEEFLESIKVRPDKDPIFNGSMIKKMDEKVHLDTTKNGLKTTLDKGAIGEGEIRLSKLQKLAIIDKSGVSVGKAIDIDFDVDGSAKLIVGGGFFEEKLEALGLKANVDIIVPGKVIEKIGEKITLKVGKEELALTMEEAIKTAAQSSAYEAKEANRQLSRVQLFTQRPM
ncbi:MAG: hypothetical protein P1Q69_13345 [Candidatus Thorarchaeota archaeon]|nr:hypothetical protein [Candidatus Thorarchaeota archaeon]